MKNKVWYKATTTHPHIETVEIGPAVQGLFGKHFATLVRYERPIAKFVITNAQVKALKRGRTINVTERMMELARIFGSRFGR